MRRGVERRGANRAAEGSGRDLSALLARLTCGRRHSEGTGRDCLLRGVREGAKVELMCRRLGAGGWERGGKGAHLLKCRPAVHHGNTADVRKN